MLYENLERNPRGLHYAKALITSPETKAIQSVSALCFE
jgi:hypothetical protein